MSPELEQAIKERIDLGHSQEQITTELLAAGYDEETVLVVYKAVVQAADQPADTGTLVGYRALISGACSLVQSQWRLLLTASGCGLGLLVAVGALMFATVIALEPTPMLAAGVGLAVGVLGIIGLIVLMFGFQRALLMRAEGLSYLQHVRLILPHIVGILLVALYIQFATSLGYLLLVVPGIALAVYLTNASLVRIAGSETGVMALVRSTQLVYGRWWGVFGRIVFTVLVFLAGLIPLFLLVMVFGGTIIADTMFGSATIAGGLSWAGLTLASVVLLLLLTVGIVLLTFLMQAVMVLLYESLRDTAVPLTSQNETKLYFWMRVIVVLGIPAMLLLNAADLYMQANDPASDWESMLQDPTAFELEQVEDQTAVEAGLEEFMREFEADFIVE